MSETTELRQLAEAATPGPWVRLDTGSEGCSVVTAPVIGTHHPRVARLTNGSLEKCQQDAAYIAAANPQTVLALLDVADAARWYAYLGPSDGVGTPGDRALDALRAALDRLAASDPGGGQ